MSKQLREQYIKQPPRLKDESRIWNPKHGPAFCVKCRNYYDKRSWKYPTRKTWRELEKDEQRKVKFVVCPACRTIREHLFEGEIEIKDIPQAFMVDLLRLIYRFAETAEAHSPEHRLIAISGNAKKLTVRTTENQLAAKLAKKIAESFKKHASANVAFSREPYEKEFIRLAFETGKRAPGWIHERHARQKDRMGIMIRTKRKS